MLKEVKVSKSNSEIDYALFKVYMDDSSSTDVLGMWTELGNLRELVLAISILDEDSSGSIIKTNYEYKTESGLSSLKSSSNSINEMWTSSYNGWKALGMVKTYGDYSEIKYTFFGLFSKQDETDEAIFKFEIRMGGLSNDPDIVYVTPS